jgi:ABC-type multidrug transport system fused ATPase/permease subunit
VFGVTAAQRSQIDRLVAAVQNLYFRTQLFARLVEGIYQSLMYLIIVAGLVGLYAMGTAHVASLGAVVLLLVRAGTYGQQAQGAYQSVRQALPYVERLQEAGGRYDASRQVAGGLELARMGTLAFECVSYAYEAGRTVLSNVSFEVAGGEAIGIVGPSGAGKSTLVQILLRLRAPGSGCYLVNGDPAEQFAREDWHRRVAYVPQEPRLLHASVAENIRFLRDLDDAAVRRAARLAGIHEDVIKWSDGYDTIVGPRADAVSGGQQQRICLARALAAQPQVLVLDEPTSALDPHSERLIQDSLETLKGELTLFVVAHRMSTLQMCGRVMVIVDGRLQAFDTVDRLQLESSYYRSASALAAGTPAARS